MKTFLANAFAVVSHTFKNFTSSFVVPILPSVPVNHYFNHRNHQSARPKSSSVFYASLSERVLTTARFEHSNFVKVTVFRVVKRLASLTETSTPAPG